jgi:hypothetical protein
MSMISFNPHTNHYYSHIIEKKTEVWDLNHLPKATQLVGCSDTAFIVRFVSFYSPKLRLFMQRCQLLIILKKMLSWDIERYSPDLTFFFWS